MKDVFIRDIFNSTTTRVSVASTGAEGDGDCFNSQMSGDGRFIVFGSKAENLVPEDTNIALDVFLVDTLNLPQ